jgi:hypothetical protein
LSNMVVTAVLRVQGPQVDVDRCLAWLPKDRIDRVWRAGERRLGGRISVASGFSLLLAEGKDSEQVLGSALLVLETIAVDLAELTRDGANSELDLGLMVGADAPTSVRIPVDLLGKLHGFNISLVVGAYPCSDE